MIMKTKTYIISGITMIMLTGMWACIIDDDCGNTMKYDSLHISFTVTDSVGNHYQRNFNIDSISIYLLEKPELASIYRIQWTRIDLSLSSITPYVGEHDIDFGIEWQENNIDTLRVLYSVEEPPNGRCTYIFNFRTCFFNGKEFPDLQIVKTL
jgi:hypothetical protein